MGKNTDRNIVTLNEILKNTQKERYAVGSFSPRYTLLIRPILKMAQKLSSPAIIQISQKEIGRYDVTLEEFSQEFYQVMEEENITVPVALHLDHTSDINIIKQAIGSGFTSVMIDASLEEFGKNVSITKDVVEYAHRRGVSVEGELGMISTTDNIETENASTVLTSPHEAKLFADRTGVDALAVSVGTAHGPYIDIEPKLDYERITEIRERVSCYLVLHGGSGVPTDMIRKAIALPGGGISKINIATDLEQAMLKALGLSASISNAELKAMDKLELDKGYIAVEKIVEDKIINYLGSQDKAWM